MAGRGPAGKHPDQRARRNADEHPVTLLRFEKGKQPALPRGVQWHAQTRAWWRMWKAAPQAETFVAADWQFLLDTALLHTQMWNGRPELAAEVRLRVAKFGQTPEDRLRLRMHFAPRTMPRTAQDSPEARGVQPAAERYGTLLALPSPDDDVT